MCIRDRLLCETNLDTVREVMERKKPDVAIIDSIQTMFDEEIGSAPGSVSQVRESTNVLMQIAKGFGITIFIVGHVTKEGNVAGPRAVSYTHLDVYKRQVQVNIPLRLP